MMLGPDSLLSLQASPGLSSSSLFWAIFSGAGAGFFLFTCERVVEYCKAKAWKRKLREGMYQLLAEEVQNNLKHLESMCKDLNWRPYWELSTDTKEAVWREIVQLLPNDATLVQLITVSYQNYQLISRQLDMLYYRDEGLRAGIYLDSTMPLAQQEIDASRRLLKQLRQAGNMGEIEEAGSETKRDTPTPDYQELSKLLEKTYENADEYTKCITCFAKSIYSTFEKCTRAPNGRVGVSRITDKDYVKMDKRILDTIELDKADGTYKFILKVEIIPPAGHNPRISMLPFMVTIPITIWMQGGRFEVKLRNGEYRFTICRENDTDLVNMVNEFLRIVQEKMQNNLSSVALQNVDIRGADAG